MPYRDGTLILVLERMNRIIEVNQELAYAVIEPGVTQQQLNDYLKSNNIPLWSDCTDSTPQGSIIGNALERGVGYTRHWDHFGHLCGLEVIMANGEPLRTGGGPAHSLTWHTHKWGTGPFIDGLFSQSNFGIVVKSGIWLMPAPEAFNCFICELCDEAKLPQMVDALRRLALKGILPCQLPYRQRSPLHGSAHGLSLRFARSRASVISRTQPAPNCALASRWRRGAPSADSTAPPPKSESPAAPSQPNSAASAK